MSKEIAEENDNNNNLVDIIEPLIPIAQNFIKNQQKELQVKEQQAKYQAEYAIKLLDFNKHKFNHHFYLLVILTIFICLLSGGLIFYIKDTPTGMLVLSHIGAIIAGLLAGLGIKRPQVKNVSE